MPALAEAQPGASKQKSINGKAVVSYRIKGNVVSADASTKSLVMHVTRANRHGRGAVGNEVTVDLSGARLRVADVNGVPSHRPGEIARRSSAGGAS